MLRLVVGSPVVAGAAPELQDMTHPELLEFTRHLALELGSSFALPRGAKCTVRGHNYCASWLQHSRDQPPVSLVGIRSHSALHIKVGLFDQKYHEVPMVFLNTYLFWIIWPEYLEFVFLNSKCFFSFPFLGLQPWIRSFLPSSTINPTLFVGFTFGGEALW